MKVAAIVKTARATAASAGIHPMMNIADPANETNIAIATAARGNLIPKLAEKRRAVASKWINFVIPPQM